MTRRLRLRTGRLSPGFTLVEVLATLVLAGVLLPVVVQGIRLCVRTSSLTRYQDTAARLAQTRMAEILLSPDTSDSETEGDFGDEAPGFRWRAVWSECDDPLMLELAVTLSWFKGPVERSVTLTTWYPAETVNE